jgi:diaminopimelate decarboxylase
MTMPGDPPQLGGCLSVRDGALYVDQCSAESLAARFGTPLYVISENQLRRNARELRQAFSSRWPGTFLLLPSIKANPALALRRILTEEDAGCDVFGEGELEAALKTGTEPGRISLNGPMKGDDLLERAIRNGVRITLDSREELERATAAAARVGNRAHVRLRIRPDLVGRDEPSEMSPSGVPVRDAIQRYKAGIPTEDLLAITEREIRDPNLDVAGIHLHLGRHSADPAIWRDAIDSLVELLPLVAAAWGGWHPRELDLGGGFPAPRDPFGRTLPQRKDAPPRSPDIEEYAAAICGHLATELEALALDPTEIELEIEPGRSLYADAGVHLTTVGNVKRQRRPQPLTWVETDSSDAYLPDVNLEFNRWICLPASNALAAPTMVADITGRSCALDVIVADAELPAVEVGDVLAILDTGAYQDAGASNFNALPRPGTALVTGAGAEMIRRHETLGDVFARDQIPDHLRDDSAGQANSDRWRVDGLDHVAVTSGDLEASLTFYRDLLGLEVRDRGETRGGEFDVTGLTDARVRWADLRLGLGQVLELIEYLEPRGEAVRPRPNDPGATHVSLRVSDIDAVYERLREASVVVLGEPLTITTPGGWEGARVFYSSDPDGVSVELIQPATWVAEPQPPLSFRASRAARR